MSIHTTFLTSKLYEYLLKISLREHPVLHALREETAKLPTYQQAIAPEQGQFFNLLVKLMGAKQALEIGTYTGYSALSVALALPKDGKLITCDIDPKATVIAKNFWQKAGLTDKIELRLGPALKTLDDLLNTQKTNHFDFIFIDADKENYDAYFEKSLLLLRPGGLIAVDNVLWQGRVIDETEQSKSTQAIRHFNQKLSKDSRVDISMIPIGDGVTLATKK